MQLMQRFMHVGGGGGVLPMSEKITELFQCMWRKEVIPQEYKDAPIIHLYSTSGKEILKSLETREASPSAGKILAKILLFRLNVHFDRRGPIPESPCGFRKDRGTIDMIFTTRKLQEKSQEQNVELRRFVDLTKAFDKVSRDE